MAWSWLERYRKWYLILSIIFLWLAGIVTFFSLQQPNIIEENLLLASAIERYGLWTIFAFDIGASMILAFFYLLTRRNRFLNVCLFIAILFATTIDLTNNLTLLYAKPLYSMLGFAEQKPMFSSFTRAEYDGSYLRDFVVSCIGGNEVLKVPLGKPVYVGSGWKNSYPERDSIMHC
jgi:hypothetical protein